MSRECMLDMANDAFIYLPRASALTFIYLSCVSGVGHGIESGKDFTVDGLSGFSKKKKKKRRHR